MSESSDNVYPKLMEMFGLPEDCRKAVITLQAGAPVVAECEVYVNMKESTETITKRYKLVEIEEGDNE
jgi:hypothetical protein